MLRDIDSPRLRALLIAMHDDGMAHRKPGEPLPEWRHEYVHFLGLFYDWSSDRVIAADPFNRSLVDLGAGGWQLGEGDALKHVLWPRVSGLRDAHAAFTLPTGADHPGHALEGGTALAAAAINRNRVAARRVEAAGFKGLASAILQCHVRDGFLKYRGQHPIATA